MQPTCFDVPNVFIAIMKEVPIFSYSVLIILISHRKRKKERKKENPRKHTRVSGIEKYPIHIFLFYRFFFYK